MGARDPDGLIFVDKDATVKCHHDDVVELEICGINFGLTMNEAFKIRVTKLEAEKLHIMSAKTGKSMSEIVREAVNETLKSFDETEETLKHE